MTCLIPTDFLHRSMSQPSILRPIIYSAADETANILDPVCLKEPDHIRWPLILESSLPSLGKQHGNGSRLGCRRRTARGPMIRGPLLIAWGRERGPGADRLPAITPYSAAHHG